MEDSAPSQVNMGKFETLIPAVQDMNKQVLPALKGLTTAGKRRGAEASPACGEAEKPLVHPLVILATARNHSRLPLHAHRISLLVVLMRERGQLRILSKGDDV